jgi:hypothetical protein
VIDKDALVAWLRDRSTSEQPLVGAVYAGLVARIERGDFDRQEDV